MRFFILFILSFAYAIVRYNIFGPVELIQIPAYISNKAFALSSAIAFMLSAYYLVKKEDEKENYWYKVGKNAIIVHIMVSIVLFSKEYYGKFFTELGVLTFNGEMMLIAGALSSFFLVKAGKNAKHPKDFLHPRSYILIFNLFHLFFMGYKGWPSIEKWHGGLPPISLISFVVSAIGVFYFFKYSSKEKKESL